MKKLFLQRGFTLIEILVTITIIGILASILFANFSDAKDTSRNKALRVELKELQLALELYKAQHDEYPAVFVQSPVDPNCPVIAAGYSTSGEDDCGVTNDIIVGLTPDFISEILKSEKSANSQCDIQYTVEDNGTWYKLAAVNCIAGANNSADSEAIKADDEFARCPSSCSAGCGGGSYDPTDASFYESIAVYSLGGECK